MNTNNNSTPTSKPMPGILRKALSTKMAQRLTYPHSVDRYLESVNPMWSIETVRAQVMSICSQTQDTVTVQLHANENWQGFKPGQFIRLTVSINGKRHTRCFSPANSIHRPDGLIEITAKLHEKAVVTRYMRDQMKVGEILEISAADGEFALPDQRPNRVLLISGGSGITPVMSMLRTLIDEQYSGKISFLHFANQAKDQLYADELLALAEKHPNVELLRCYAEGTEGELCGLFSEEQLATSIPDFQDATSFLCGPPGLMQAVEDTYARHGISEQLHLERFTLAKPTIVSENPAGDVHFLQSERYTANTGETLLEQAEAAGLKPQSGCRMGVCYACTCRKTSGQVRDLRSGLISDTEEADIQLCVSVPVGNVTLDI